MAQSALASWKKFLQEAGIPDPDAATYAKKIDENRITDHLDLTIVSSGVGSPPFKI